MRKSARNHWMLRIPHPRVCRCPSLPADRGVDCIVERDELLPQRRRLHFFSLSFPLAQQQQLWMFVREACKRRHHSLAAGLRPCCGRSLLESSGERSLHPALLLRPLVRLVQRTLVAQRLEAQRASGRFTMEEKAILEERVHRGEEGTPSCRERGRRKRSRRGSGVVGRESARGGGLECECVGCLTHAQH